MSIIKVASKTAIALLLGLPSLPAKGQDNYSFRIIKYFEAQGKVNEFSGAVLITKKGNVLVKKAFGLANREWNVRNTPQTKFRIGSVTKQFTAAAILQLHQAGKLSIEDRLSKYFTDFPKGDSVTLHMLMNHTSGIKSYTNIPKVGKLGTLPYEKDSVITLFKNEPYEFTPGTNYNYNNSGYFLLGRIIEKVSGETYDRYILNNVIKKAGPENTIVNRLDTILINRAAGYSRTQTGWQNTEYYSMAFPYSAGAIISTVEDLYIWNKALFSGKIVSPEMFTKMTTPGLRKYGYGLIIDSALNQRIIGHSGTIPGFTAYNFIFPVDDIHVIILSNNNSNLEAISFALNAILFGKEVIDPYQHREIQIDSKYLEKFVGKYQTDIGQFELHIKDGKLYRKTGGGDMALKAESIHKFFFADGSDRQLNFVLNAHGIVTKAQIIRNGVVQEIKKTD